MTGETILVTGGARGGALMRGSERTRGLGRVPASQIARGGGVMRRLALLALLALPLMAFGEDAGCDGRMRDSRSGGADGCEGRLSAQRTIARSLAEKERAVAVGVLGAGVCRRMTAGIATHDWVRGTVVAIEGEMIAVRINHAGAFEHAIGGVSLASGAIVRDSMQSWVPCQ